MPRDRDGQFEPRLIGKHERRFTGFDDKIIALYARGMTVREIQGFSPRCTRVEVSPDLISTVTDAVMAEVTAWQSAAARADVSGGVLRRAAREDSRRGGRCAARRSIWRWPCCRTARATSSGIWIEQTEGAKFWMKVFTDLKTRGCQDILIAVTDGLKGMSEALAAVFPGDDAADLHRASDPPQPGLRQLEGAQAAGRGAAADLHGASAEAAAAALDAFERGPWGRRVPDGRRRPGAAPGRT